MKNNKGFTLIELLAVVIVLGAVMLVAFPSAWDAINNVDKKVVELNKKMAKEGAKTFAQEIVFCELSADAKALLNSMASGYGNKSCSELMTYFGTARGVSIANLIKNHYINDETAASNGTGGHCSGKLNVKINSSDYSITVTEGTGFTCHS